MPFVARETKLADEVNGLMAITNCDLLKRVYDAFNARDIDALALMDQAVDWPNGMDGGRVHGRSGVREYWTRQWRLINPRVEPCAFHSDTHGPITVEVHQVVRDPAGAVVSDKFVQHVYEIRGGLIMRMEIINL